MKHLNKLLISFVLLALLSPLAAVADDLIMRRVSSTFPETMNALQSTIAGEGYTVSRVQRVDIGLTSSGYSTAEYRIVFFMNEDKVHEIVKAHPELIPFLPLKITIFAEGNETILVTLNPAKLGEFFPDMKMKKEFDEWEASVNRIFDKVQAE